MSFPLAGNARIRGALTAAIESGRLPHAILIEGDKGTGRHTLAAFTARAAVCEGENKPCGECRGCRLEHAGTHPDIWTVAPEDGKKNITVAQIRSLRSEAYVKPHMSARRVFIIDMADTMNEQAQNALLKVLEEPPGSVLFILIAENKAALLDTVISRCTVLSLSPPEISEAEKYLGYPYVWGGASPSTSFDCSGYVSWVINNCGVGWSFGRLSAEGIRQICSYVSPADAKPGDLIFFEKTYNTTGASHIGIYVGNNTMLHCGDPIQYTSISSDYWQSHFLQFGRLAPP